MSDINNMIDPAAYYRDVQNQAMAQRASQSADKTLGMQDFITLLVAQMTNQDMMNPMDNTEFIAQMATFSTLTAMNNLSDQSMTSYAVSLLGKEVTAAVMDPFTGQLERVEGVVTGISLFEGSPKVYIGDRVFDLQSIMTVGKLPEIDEGDKDKEDPEEGGDGEIEEPGDGGEGK